MHKTSNLNERLYNFCIFVSLYLSSYTENLILNYSRYINLFCFIYVYVFQNNIIIITDNVTTEYNVWLLGCIFLPFR